MKIFNTLFTFTMIAAISIQLLACVQFPGQNAGFNTEVEELEKGYYSNYPHNGEVQKVIRSHSELSEKWNKVFSSRHPVPELPDITFDDRQVILLMLDTKPSGGFGITDLEVIEEESRFRVRYSEIKPGNGCMLTQAITKPYVFISIPSNEKTVKFQKKDAVINECR